MLELKDSVLIHVPPARVWAWLGELPRHYAEWHPDHVACRFERGHTLQPGAVLVVEERLHGRLHRFRLRATEVDPERLLRYRGRGFEGAFVLGAEGGGTRLQAELSFGTPWPVIGALLDKVAGALLRRRLAALKQHMREEGENLKRLLEEESSGGERPA